MAVIIVLIIYFSGYVVSLFLLGKKSDRCEDILDNMILSAGSWAVVLLTVSVMQEEKREKKEERK